MAHGQTFSASGLEEYSREDNGDMDAVGHGHVAGLLGSGSSVHRLWHHNLRKGLKGLAKSMEDLSWQSSPRLPNASTKAAAPFSPASRVTFLSLENSGWCFWKGNSNVPFPQKGISQVWYQAQLGLLTWEGNIKT